MAAVCVLDEFEVHKNERFLKTARELEPEKLFRFRESKGTEQAEPFGEALDLSKAPPRQRGFVRDVLIPHFQSV